MNRKMNAFLRMVPLALVMGTIFFLSHQPGNSLSLPKIPGADKLVHMIAYSVLAGAVFVAWSEQRKDRNPLALILFTFVFCFFYGISDEFHQSFIPGRTASVYDLLADCAGAAITCTFWARWRKKVIMIRYQ